MDAMIISVVGRCTTICVPAPNVVSTSMVPPNFSRVTFTTSIPTPRPDNPVTASAVENPGLKINLLASASRIFSASAWEIRPFLTAFALTLLVSIPRPSSRTEITTCPPSFLASKQMVPDASLPAANRSCWSSIPWSAQFLIRWVSGSERDSIMVRSSSVSSPRISSLIGLFS